MPRFSPKHYRVLKLILQRARNRGADTEIVEEEMVKEFQLDNQRFSEERFKDNE